MYVQIHMIKWHSKGKSVYERIRQIAFFRVSRVPKQRTGIFKAPNTCTNLCNNMVQKTAGVKKQNSEKGFQKNENACIVEGVAGFRIFYPSGIYRFPARLGKFKARLSSDRYERETQKFRIRRWGSLA